MATNKNYIKNSNSIGQVFTPDYIAEFMVKNLVEFLKREGREDKIPAFTVLEPAAGEGVFLKYLYNNHFSNITAYELDNCLQRELQKKFPTIEFRFENFFSTGTDEKFDLIIGNPPYLGQNYNAEVFQEYNKKFPICAKYFVGNMDLFYYFIHLGIEKLKPGGLLSFITTNYWITKSKKTGIKFLKPHILNETFLIQYYDLSDLNLFPDATGQHNCIFVLQKKTAKDKLEKVDKNIEVAKIKKGIPSGLAENDLNKKVLMQLLSEKDFTYGSKYLSALTNKDLKNDDSWNLLYPKEVKEIVDYIQDFCTLNGQVIYLKDLFMMRNGIIFPKDDIFILKENQNIKIDANEIYISIDDHKVKINNAEKNQIKKVYKSKSIEPFKYNSQDFVGYGIFLNRNEFLNVNKGIRNLQYEKKYPQLTTYLKQYEPLLRDILINAKEHPEDIYFPRRGAFIKKKERNKEILVDLEPFYDRSPKIFIRYITKENIFGFTNLSYYATSDTYFLWPKKSDKKIDYPFIVAFLNSKITSFLFTAKNIAIKRSKTKLEEGIPIPNLEYFRSEKDILLLSLIRHLARRLMNYDPEEFDESFYRLHTIVYLKDLIDDLVHSIKKNDYDTMIDFIDLFFFELFGLDEQYIEDLLKKFY